MGIVSGIKGGVSKVVGGIRNVGEKIGDVIRDLSLAKGYVYSPKSQVTYDTTTGTARPSTPADTSGKKVSPPTSTSKPYTPSKTGGGGVSGGQVSNGISTPTVSYDAAKDIQKTNVQIPTISQNIQQQLLLQHQQRLNEPTFYSNYPSIRDTAKGIKNIYTTTKEKVVSSLKPVYKSVTGSETAKMFSKGGEKVTGALNIIENKVRNTLQPKTPAEEQLARESVQTIKLSEDYQKEMDKRNQLVNDLNIKYGNEKELNEKDFSQYTKEKNQIESVDKKLANTERYLLQQEAYLKSKEKYLRVQRENAPSQFVTSILIGIVTFPVTTVKLGVGLITKPVTTIKETIQGFKELPKQFVEKPISTTGEIIGQVIGGVLTGQIIKLARGGKIPTLSEQQAIKTSTNKLLGLTDDFKTKIITFNEEITIRNKLLSSGAFADDSNVQSFIKSASIGKAKRTTSAGVTTERFIVKGIMNNKEYTLTFSERAGKITSPRLAIADNNLVKVYRPAYPSEIPKPTYEQGIKIERIEQLRQTGVYAKSGKVTAYKEIPVGDKVLKLTESQAKIFQVGKGSTATKSYADVFNLDKQPSSFKLLKQPKQIAEATAKKIEMFKEPTFNIIEDDLILKQKSIAYEKAVSKLTSPVVEFDIKKMIKKPTKKPFEYLKDTSAELSKDINKIINKIETSQTIKITPKIKAVTFESLTSPQEMGFNIRKAVMPKKIIKESRFSDYTKSSFGNLGVAETKFGNAIEWDFDKLQDNINKSENRMRDLTMVKPTLRRKEQEKDKTILDTFTRLTSKSSAGNKDIQKNLESLGIIQKQNQQQKQLQRQMQKLDMAQPQISNIKYPRTPKIPEIFKPFKLPSAKKQEEDYKRLYNKIIRIQPKFKPKYTASLGAAIFQSKPLKVSSKEFERLSRKVYSGGETRPVLFVSDESDKQLKKQLKAVNF